MNSILIVAKEQDVFATIYACLHSEYRIDKGLNKDHAFEKLKKKRYDFIFIDLEILQASMQAGEYQEALQPFLRLYPTTEIIILASKDMIKKAVMAVKAGATNYLTYPIDLDELKYVTEDIRESVIVQSELDYLRDRFWQSEELVQTSCPEMKKVFDKIRSVAPTKSTVLLTGETGTGKGVLAKLIHRHSNRRDDQFISVHCGAIPDTLLESELFGHEKGAFTGAIREKLGKFEIAKGGTIFLDEIATITPSAQIKLLQVLQDGIFQRVGGEETIEADSRVITATNMDLRKMCSEGEFRKDLYYRLNVFPIEIPPLNKRIEDIPYFVEVFLKNLNKFNSKDIQKVHPLVLEAFTDYSWPGNIRELENLMERAYILETSHVLTPESFPTELFESQGSLSNLPVDSSLALKEVRRKGTEDIERLYLKGLLTQFKGIIKDSAEAAGISTRQLHKLMKKYGLRKEEFKSFV